MTPVGRLRRNRLGLDPLRRLRRVLGRAFEHEELFEGLRHRAEERGVESRVLVGHARGADPAASTSSEGLVTLEAVRIIKYAAPTGAR